jgi:hypothetical protein
MHEDQTLSIESALKSKREALLRKLATIEERIIQVDEAKTQLGEKITVLEQGQRQAA